MATIKPDDFRFRLRLQAAEGVLLRKPDALVPLIAENERRIRNEIQKIADHAGPSNAGDGVGPGSAGD